MASYLRDSERTESTLPSIRRSQAWEASAAANRRADALLASDRNVHYHGYQGRSRSPARMEDPAVFIPRPPSPGHRPRSPGHMEQHRRQASDMHDQVSFYRDEIAKKDRLISQLTSMPDTPRATLLDGSTAKIEELYSTERISEMATVKSESAGLRVKVDGLQSRLREMQVQLDTREEKIRELKIHVETSRESEAKQHAIVDSLRQKVVQYEAQYGSLEGAANRSELAINTLQRDSSAQQERILELESRIRKSLEEKDAAFAERSLIIRHMTEVITKINSVLNLDLDLSFSSTSWDSLSRLATKVGDLVHENDMLRGKIASMRDHMDSAQLEHKASRETIMRLVSEAEREQKFSSKYSLELESLRLERDQFGVKMTDTVREIELLKERLDASQQAYHSTRRELEQKEGRYTEIDITLRDHELAVRNAEMSFKTFKQMLASLLSDGMVTVEGFEETIRERVSNLMLSIRDKSSHIDLLEIKVRELSTQLETQCDLHRNADVKSRRMEADFLSLEERLRRAESELAAGEALRDGFRVDKDRYMRFLERISHAMKMDTITINMGMDSCSDAILARADQLVKLEYEALNDRKTHIYNLQRKVKSQKEQLESKELHMELMRKKVIALEERLVGRTELDREKDEEYVKNRKLVKLIEKYKLELNEARLEIRDLKATLLESSEMRSITMAQGREMENLEVKVGELEHVRERQAQKIGALKDSMQMSESKLQERNGTSKNTIHALSSELRTTKSALGEISKREKQLLDLRAVVSRMLGLEVNTLAVPDYEIISRLEKLILANQSHAHTVIALDNVVEDMQDGFRSGYQDASRALATTAAINQSIKAHTGKASRSPMHSRTRSRSMSPSRKRDPRQY